MIIYFFVYVGFFILIVFTVRKTFTVSPKKEYEAWQWLSIYSSLGWPLFRSQHPNLEAHNSRSGVSDSLFSGMSQVYTWKTCLYTQTVYTKNWDKLVLKIVVTYKAIRTKPL